MCLSMIDTVWSIPSELNQEKKNIPVTKEIIFVCQNYILFIDKCFQVGLISLISTMLLEDL